MGLRNRDAILKRNMDIVQHNLALLRTFFQKHAEQMQWCAPSGSSVAFPKLISGTQLCLCELTDWHARIRSLCIKAPVAV